MMSSPVHSMMHCEPAALELRHITKTSEDMPLLEAINTEAIPECERNSLDDLLDSGADVLGIYQNSRPTGFFVLRSFRSTRYLAYFAVQKELRGQGLGSTALQALLSRYPDCQTVVEYEAPDKAGDANDIRQRRKQFYLRNGFRQTGWNTFYDGTEFELGCAGISYDAAEFADFIAYLSTIISDHIPQPYRKKMRKG
ncbi:MAG: GNAT family N-acetyltransferase [Oscillospiraceae bacterium]|nr:GNAT family N-acetyltransferase [Oscillospiraceae bacterium]